MNIIYEKKLWNCLRLFVICKIFSYSSQRLQTFCALWLYTILFYAPCFVCLFLYFFFLILVMPQTHINTHCTCTFCIKSLDFQFLHFAMWLEDKLKNVPILIFFLEENCRSQQWTAYKQSYRWHKQRSNHNNNN